MNRRVLLRSWFISPAAGWLGRWVPRSLGGPALDEPNAAEIYWEALGWAKRLTPEDSERLRNCATTPLDDADIETLLRKARPVVASLRKATAVKKCDWGPEIVSSEDLVEGHLDFAMHKIVGIACLSARQHVRFRRNHKALDDLSAGLSLSHRIGTSGFFIARLMECHGEIMVFKTLGRILPLLDGETLDDLLHRLDALPPPEPASATIKAESRYILGHLHKELKSTGPALRDEEWSGYGFSKEDAEGLKRLTGGDRAKILAHLDENGPAFAELARRLDLPRPGCRAALDEFAKAERERHPIVAELVESAWGCRHVVDRMLGLRAMLRAGIALIREGEPAFRAVRDPFGNGAFELEKRGNVHLIRSALRDEAKPEVSLMIGDE